MSDDMKQVLTMLAALTTQVGELKEELAALKKQPKPTPVKEEKPDTSFAGLYGSHLTNPDGSGKKLKHTADTKDGGEDDWYGVWDAKNKVIKRINEDGRRSRARRAAPRAPAASPTPPPLLRAEVEVGSSTSPSPRTAAASRSRARRKSRRLPLCWSLPLPRPSPRSACRSAKTRTRNTALMST